VGEKVDALEPFHPDRIVSRLLGMGDVLSLIEEIGQKVDHKKAEKAAKKMAKGQFDLEDMRDQLLQMEQMHFFTFYCPHHLILNTLRYLPHAWHFIHQGFYTAHLFHLQQLITHIFTRC
jgi:hypothetical protein